MPDIRPTASEILGLFNAWNKALQSGDPDRVRALYAPDANLVPTISNEVRSSPDAIRDYFAVFLKLNPTSRIVTNNIGIHGDIATNSGVYVFDTAGRDLREEITCRFTFVYRRDPEGWRIIEHHSSMMPVAC